MFVSGICNFIQSMFACRDSGEFYLSSAASTMPNSVQNYLSHELPQIDALTSDLNLNTTTVSDLNINSVSVSDIWCCKSPTEEQILLGCLLSQFYYQSVICLQLYGRWAVHRSLASRVTSDGFLMTDGLVSTAWSADITELTRKPCCYKESTWCCMFLPTPNDSNYYLHSLHKSRCEREIVNQ